MRKLSFEYKTLLECEIIIYRRFSFPVRIETFINQVNDLLGKDNILKKDEMGIILSYQNINSTVNSVLAVGLGDGISLIYNLSFNNHSEFKYTVIEASKSQIDLAKKNIELNNINDQNFDIIDGLVGEGRNVYGTKKDMTTNLVDINEFKFDLLELDCEGSEVEILNNLSVRPKHIIVEMHPNLVFINFDEFINMTFSMGYNLTSAFTVSGIKIDLKNVPFYFSNNYLNSIKNISNLSDYLLVLTLSRN